jgi:hypothetical protein
VVAHAYNPSHSGGKDEDDHGLSPAWAKKLTRPYLNKEKAGQVKGIYRRFMIQASSGIKVRSYLKNNQSKQEVLSSIPTAIKKKNKKKNF